MPRRTKQNDQERGRGSGRDRRPGEGRQRGRGRHEDVNDMSREDLYRMAQEQGISGRSQMNKRELIQALRGR